MSKRLIISAGKTAFLKIKDAGLQPGDVKVMAGAAGGPKWLILAHLDRALFSSWFKNRTEPLFLIGSSSGAWRFASVSQADPVAAIDRFQTAYIGQRYGSKPSPADVSLEGKKIQNYLLGINGTNEILTHPYLRLNIMTARCKGLTAREEKFFLMMGMALAAFCNGIHRKWLKLFVERALLYDPRDTPPFFNMDEFPIQKIPLTNKNIKQGLLASGSIPLVMSGVKDIPGAFPGIYRDGGVTDYHMDIPFNGKDGIVLFPHYTNRIIPGWLDKSLWWRKPLHTDHVLLAAPSPEFLKQLPYQKIPDRNDFRLFQGRDKERISYWEKAAEMGKELADEFMELLESGRIRDFIIRL